MRFHRRRACALAAIAAVGLLAAVSGQAALAAEQAAHASGQAAHAAAQMSRAHRSLYVRLGGAPVVKAVVSDTVDGMLADPRLSPPFQGVNTRRTKRLITAFICQLAGGGCHYTGATMHDAHANLHITEAQFFGMVQILRKAMRRHHIPIRERNELLARLAPLEPDIVEVKVPPPPRAH